MIHFTCVSKPLRWFFFSSSLLSLVLLFHFIHSGTHTFLCAFNSSVNDHDQEISWQSHAHTRTQASVKYLRARQVCWMQCDCDSIVHQPIRFHSSSQSIEVWIVFAQFSNGYWRPLIHTEYDKLLSQKSTHYIDIYKIVKFSSQKANPSMIWLFQPENTEKIFRKSKTTFHLNIWKK